MNTTPAVSTPAVAVGLDVSKDTLDACLLIRSKRQRNNLPMTQRSPPVAAMGTVSGQRALLPLLLRKPLGHTPKAVALFLVETEQRVSVINPARIKYFGLAQNPGQQDRQSRCSSNRPLLSDAEPTALAQ
jgi:hypothetical protein